MKHLKRSQIAASNYHYIKYSLDYFLRSMVNLDQHLIEFYAASPHLSIEDAGYRELTELKKKLDEREIRVCCFTQEQCVYPINIACEDEKIRERSIGTFFKSIEGAAVLEAASYNTTNVVYTTKLMRKMIDEIGSRNLKGMLDTCAVAMAGEDFREDMELLGGDMVHLHFADGNPLGHFIPGEGELPLSEYLHVLDDFAYGGAIPFEIYNRKYDFEPEETMKKCLDFMYGMIQG